MAKGTKELRGYTRVRAQRCNRQRAVEIEQIRLQATIDTIRAVYRQGPAPREGSATDPKVLRALAESLGAPYAVVAAAALEGADPKAPLLTLDDLDELVAGLPGGRDIDEATPEARTARVRAICETIIALMDEGMQLDANGDGELRRVAVELGVPAMVVGITVEQYYSNARITMPDIDACLAWMSTNEIEDSVLYKREVWAWPV